MKLADGFPPQQTEGREQSGRPVALGMMRHRSAMAVLRRQAPLSAVQSLNLALFIDTKDDRFVGWIEMEADNSGQFFKKLRIARQLEIPSAMGLDFVAVPEIADVDSLTRCHEAPIPVRTALWF